ncbi:MAG: galactose-1-epimerase [Flavobacteriales bacterium]|nr:galactose-1-epimerase [Flavobacteriales bacterium]
MKQQLYSDGLPSQVFTLTNQQGSSIAVMDIGATWLSCKIQLRNELREVLLGVDSMHKHLSQQAYLGATIGRYANRIKHGKFSINDQEYQTETNQAGNTLHGGVEGFDKRRWQLTEQRENKITFSLTSKNGDQGFPGNLKVSVSYSFSEQNEVSIEYFGKIDQACPVNLTNHAYFNLIGADKGGDCLTHHLQINAEYYLPSDDSGIPLGHLKSVVGSSFDFVNGKRIQQGFLSEAQQTRHAGYDHSFLIRDECRGSCAIAATLTAPDQSLQLHVKTTKPALHLYTGNFLQGTPSRRLNPYKNHAGIALETHYFPDSPNHLQWAQHSPLLQPHQTYHSISSYCFTTL